MKNIHVTAKFGEIGIFLSEKMGANDVSKALILISELKDLIRQEERERAQKIIESAPSKKSCPYHGCCSEDSDRFENWKQEALKKLNL